jgi:hypothetical protein
MLKNVKNTYWYIVNLYLTRLFKFVWLDWKCQQINMPMCSGGGGGGVGKARKGIDTSMDDEGLQGMDNFVCLQIWALTCPCLMKPFKAPYYIWFKCVSNSQFTTILSVLNGH